jgi:CPA2 family monovalent cation:H+ antiporter-2
MDLIRDLVIILGVSLFVIIISSKVKLPAIAGFLITGIIIGPYGLGFIGNTEDIKIFAEIGIVLMMFIIGIEFSLRRFMKIRKLIFISGGLQVGLTILAVTLILFLTGIGIKISILAGFLIAMSSTAIVLKILQDRKELGTPHGKMSLAILLFQDLCVVPMLILVPMIGQGVDDVSGTILYVLLLFAGVTAFFFLARFLFPVFLRIIAHTRLSEIFIMGSLLLCIGSAYLAHLAGLSLALGSFLAGLIISETRYSHQVTAEILPFKESFNSIFFVSAGMFLNLMFVYSNIPRLLIVCISIIAIKAIIIIGTVMFMKYSVRNAVITGFGLAQIGEFSLILSGLGRDNGIITEEIYQLLLASAIVSMIFTPFAFMLSKKAVKTLEKGKLFAPLMDKFNSNIKEKTTSDGIKLEDHVIIVGYGANGKNIAKVLKKLKIGYSIIEINPVSSRVAAEKGEYVVYGDTTRELILKEAGIKKARIIVFAVSDPLIEERAVMAARKLNKDIIIIARTKYMMNIDSLCEMGATEVYAEELETSMGILSRIMRIYDLPVFMINRELSGINQGRYMERIEEHPIPQTEALLSAIPEDVAIETIIIRDNWLSAGRSIASLDLRHRSGSTIISVIRGSESHPNPMADFVIEKGDSVVLMGKSDEVINAIDVFRKG